MENLIARMTVLAAMAALPVLAAQAPPASRQTFDQYVSELHQRPDDIALREKIITAAQSMTPRPAVPEEASRHFIRASVFVKEAQSQGDLGAARSELDQALLLAPWWGAGYYYLAVLDEETGRFDDATANMKLYLLTRPAAKNAKAAQDRMYAIEVEKGIDARRRTAIEAAAQQRQEDADWRQLKAALDAQDKQAALAGPWIRTSGICSAATANFANGNIGGSMTFIINTSGSTILGTTNSSMNLTAGFSGTVNNGAIDGQASFGGYKIGYGGACQVAAATQGLSGSVSADGRSMELDTTVTSYAAQTQGLIITTCTGVSPANQQIARCFLVSQAPHLIPLLQVAASLPPGSPNIDQAEAIRLVLTHGGGVNQADANGFTALHLAASRGNSQIVGVLIDSGAQIDAVNNNNDTSLIYAIESGSVDTVKLLLAHGARPDLVDNAGMSPLFLSVAASGVKPQ